MASQGGGVTVLNMDFLQGYESARLANFKLLVLGWALGVVTAVALAWCGWGVWS